MCCVCKRTIYKILSFMMSSYWRQAIQSRKGNRRRRRFHEIDLKSLPRETRIGSIKMVAERNYHSRGEGGCRPLPINRLVEWVEINKELLITVKNLSKKMEIIRNRTVNVLFLEKEKRWATARCKYIGRRKIDRHVRPFRNPQPCPRISLPVSIINFHQGAAVRRCRNQCRV